MRPSGVIAINGGDAYSRSTDVVINNEIENVAEMRFSNDQAAWSGWEPYAATKDWIIEAGHGIKTVYGEFRNSAGGTAIVSDTIVPLVEEKITASDPCNNAIFGGGHWNFTTSSLVLSSDGRYLIASSTLNNTVYVYDKSNNWAEYKLMSPDPGMMYFGNSIACTPDANLLVVGALYKPAIYIYKKVGNIYSLERRIDSPTPSVINDFAVAVSISDDGNRIIVGSWNAASGSGRAYFYKKNGGDWSTYTMTTLNPPDGYTGGRFGLGVKISGDGNTVITGAPFLNSRKGILFVYRWDGNDWGIPFILAASDGANDDLLGRHISVLGDGNRILVGTRFSSLGNQNQGSAYLFEWNGTDYVEIKKFMAYDGYPDDKYGLCVAMSADGTAVAISAPGNQQSLMSVIGKSYIYRFNGFDWDEDYVLMAADGLNGDFYGNQIAISGDASTIAVGAPLDDTGATTDSGSVYVYY